MNNLSFKKIIYFYTFLAAGVFYTLFLFTFFLQIAKSCFTNLLLYFNQDISWSRFLTSKDFLINSLGILFFTILLSKFVFALVKISYKIYLTNSKISKLSYTLHNNIRLITEPGIVFTAGFLKPQVYISKDLKTKLSKKEFNAVLNHELKHKKDFDPLKKVILEFLKDILPSLPFKNEIFGSLNLIIELCADEYANKTSEKESIVKALVKIIKTSDYYNLSLSGFNEQKERINILTGNNLFNHKRFIYMIIFLLSVTIYPAFFIANNSYFNKCDNLESCYSEYMNLRQNGVCYVNLINVNHSELQTKVLNYSEDVRYSQI